MRNRYPLLLLALAACLTWGCDGAGDDDGEGDDDDSVGDDDDSVGDDDDTGDDDDDTGDDDDSVGDDDDDTDPANPCPPLPAASGNVIAVDPSQAGDLAAIVAGAATGDTIELAAGTYALHGDYLWFGTPGVTLRGATGDPADVIIDGDYETTEIVAIVAPDITIADVTLREAYYHPIHVSTAGEMDVTGTLIYHVDIVDPREQGIKINPNDNGFYTDDGEIACSHIELTDAGRPVVDNNCYTGGIDAHQARGWVIRDNVIEGFWCDAGLSEHGIHLWRACRDTVVERNVLRNNARGIGFGLVEDAGGRVYDDAPCGGETVVGHYDGIIRNNFVYADDGDLFSSQYGCDGGISLAQACGAEVVHNTVATTQAPFASIEYRFSHTDATIANNLVTHDIMQRDGAVADLQGNVDGASMTLFADPSSGYLHLDPGAADAIDQGVTLDPGTCDTDFDGEPRSDGAPDVGADEL